MPKIALIVHGILSNDNDSGPARLEPYLQAAGFWTLRVPVGWGFLLRPITRNRIEAGLIAAFTQLLANLGNEIVAIGHSNGARICALASEYGAPFQVLVFIDGAVDRNVKIGKQVGAVLNAHVPDDPVLTLAAVIPFSPWGDLGKVGFDPDSDPRLWNANLGRGDLPGAEGIVLHGHNDFFRQENLPKLGPWLVRAIESLRGKGQPS